MQGQEPELASMGASSIQKDSGALRIAFLDDDAEQADRISALLQSAGHNVYVFNRGRALLSQLRCDTYDLIVLDWEVPDLSGNVHCVKAGKHDPGIYDLAVYKARRRNGTAVFILRTTALVDGTNRAIHRAPAPNVK